MQVLGVLRYSGSHSGGLHHGHYLLRRVVQGPLLHQAIQLLSVLKPALQGS